MSEHPSRPIWWKTTERRKDTATADIIQIGLMYMKIFGRDKGENYFKKTVVAKPTYRRIVLGCYRGTGARINDDPTQSFI